MSITARGTEDRVALGIALTLAAYLLFSGVDTTVKWLSSLAYPALQLAFMRYVSHFLISGARIVHAGSSWHDMIPNQLGLVSLRGSMILLSTVLNFMALQYLPLTLTSTILFSAPIIVCLLSGTMLGEQVGRWRWFAIILGFCGVIIAIRPFDDDFQWATLLSIGAALCFSLYLILTRRLAGSEGSDILQFYSALVGCVTLLPFAVYLWQQPGNSAQWLGLIGIGVLAWAGHELLTRAYRFADATVLTPYNYSFVIFVTVWSVLLFNHFPDRWTIAGAAVIVTSGLIIWVRERTRSAE